MKKRLVEYRRNYINKQNESLKMTQTYNLFIDNVCCRNIFLLVKYMRMVLKTVDEYISPFFFLIKISFLR